MFVNIESSGRSADEQQAQQETGSRCVVSLSVCLSVCL